MYDWTLTRIYYTAPNLYEKTYESRYHAPFALHLGFEIHQYNRRKSYPAFFYYNQDFVHCMEEIYKAYGTFLEIKHKISPLLRYQFAFLSIIDEITATNDIEGIQTTKKEIRNILDSKVNKTGGLTSIVNAYRSLLDDKKTSFKTCKDVRHFYDEFIHKEVVTQNKNQALDGILFRKDPVNIESAKGKIIHQGLFPEIQIIEAMEKALNMINSTQYPFLVSLSLFHYIFAYIHPFYDGNGRTDRFITSYFLKQEFDILIASRLSIYIKRNRKKYYRLFAETDSEINRGDLTPFIIGFLQIIQGVIEETIQLLIRKNEQLEKYTQKLKSFYGQNKLLEKLYYILLQTALFYGQGITITQLSEISKENQNTIQKQLDLIPRNHLQIKKNGKSIYYKLNPMILKSLFTDCNEQKP